MVRGPFCLLLIAATTCASGCRSPYAQDRLAATGAGLGGVAGAIIGHQKGHAAGGALIGAALGTAAGAVTGAAIDEAEARNRREIAARMGRPAPRGAVNVEEVIAMVHAGVPEAIVASHVQRRGMSHPIGSAELIHMQQQGVPQSVMAATQRGVVPVAHHSVPAETVVIERHRPTTVIVERPPCYRHRRWHHHHRPCRPHVGFGISSHHHW